MLDWVHAARVDSQLRTYTLFVGRLTADEKDRCCAEGAQVGPRLGIVEHARRLRATALVVRAVRRVAPPARREWPAARRTTRRRQGDD